MSSNTLLAVVGVLGTLGGVLVGFGLNRWAAKKDQQRELRSISEALLWELKDSRHPLGAKPAILEVPIPSVNTLLERGLLVLLPFDVRAGVLGARSLIEIHNRMLAQHRELLKGDPARVENLGTLTEQAQEALRFAEAAIQQLECYRERTDYGLLRRLMLRMLGKPFSRVTPR